MGEEEREQFIGTINDIVEKLDGKASRQSETTHWVTYEREVLLVVEEAARTITHQKPYRLMPEEFQYLIDEGKKAGYRIHDYTEGFNSHLFGK